MVLESRQGEPRHARSWYRACRGLPLSSDDRRQNRRDRAMDPWINRLILCFIYERDRLLPADTMPLSARSKLLMMVEAGASLLTVGLAAALAVNVLV